MINQVFFGYFATVIIVLSLLIVTRKNLVHSVLAMLALFFHIAALYLFLNAEFIAAVQIIVYAGAIMVLFLFVIMLLNLREDTRRKHYIGPWIPAFILGTGIIVELIMASYLFKAGRTGQWSISRVQGMGHTKALGFELFTEYLLPFELASLILLVAVIGAIVLAKKKLKD